MTKKTTPNPDVADGGGDDPSLRRCLVSGESQPTDLLLRFVVGPDDTMVPDLEERLPGRGFWLSARRDVVETAVKRKAFHRAVRRAVTVPEDLAATIERLLLRRCQDSLGLARRSGRAVCGFDKVASALAEGPGLLIEAADGRPDGRQKIAAQIRRTGSAARVIDSGLSAEELGFPFARDRAVHVWVSSGPLADRIARDMRRLAAFRGTTDHGAPNGVTTDI